MDELGQRWEQLQQRIAAACERSGRSPDEVNVVAVTKYVSTDQMKKALQLGVKHLGENRVQHAVQKWEELGDSGVWHFIGHLQTNKVKDIIGKFDYIHSLDRISLLKEIEKRARMQGIKVSCFVQVNVSGEESKYGMPPHQLFDFMQEAARMEHINICGLMTMAPLVDNPEEVRSVFRELRMLKDKVNAAYIPGVEIQHLSMGMSGDFEVAIEEGATFIRVGSYLFSQ